MDDWSHRFCLGMTPLSRSRLGALFALLMLASACSTGADVPDNPAAAAASAEAAANIDNLQQSDNVFDIELLDVADGTVSTLGQAIDGDRPVLIWFYSPH